MEWGVEYGHAHCTVNLYIKKHRWLSMGEQAAAENQSKLNNNYMTLEIKNYGPISHGVVHLKPLTILVGPSGCGKSYVSRLVHAVVDAESDYYVWQGIKNSKVPTSDVVKLIHKESEHILQQQSHDIIQSDFYNTITDFKSDIFQKNLQENSAAGYERLIGAEKQYFELTASSKYIYDKIKYTSAGLKVEHINKTGLNIVLGNQHDRVPKIIHAQDDMVKISAFNDFNKNYIFDLLVYALKHYKTHTPKISDAIYFPSERSGLTLAHRAIIRDYYTRDGDVNVSMADAQLSRVMASFLKHLVLHDNGNNGGTFADIVSDFEREAFSADIITKSGVGNLDDIYLRRDGYDFPLHAASSSVKHLAVFLLFMQRSAMPGNLIILEEPESHLDPYTQTLLAKLVARLVHRGVYVIINTHSPYFLEQLSHCVMASSLGDKVINTLQNDARINPNDVAAYEFVSDNGGFSISTINIGPEGISQSVFINVDDQMHDKYVELIQADHP